LSDAGSEEGSGNGSPLEARVRELETQLAEVQGRARLEQDRLLASVADKELLLREVHHRVKNNLQVIASLLSLQSRYAKGDDHRAAFDDMHNRVTAMALVHEELNLGSGDEAIDLKRFTKRLVGSLILIYAEGGVSHHFVLEAESLRVDLDTAVTLGLLLNEAISNAFKHAFPRGSAGEITVRLWSAKEGGVHLSIADNGRGFEMGFDPMNSGTLGLSLMGSLVTQLSGELKVANNEGAVLQVWVPVAGATKGSP
jgi:two-component sensor histidine kinase